jgi:phytoene dehydrogenase-like protein
MARVVVVGGGFGGLASAARLAKLGHEVTLVEASDRLGGALGHVEQDGFRWDSGPTTTLLPAVIRDLFRKSGRAAEKEIDLVPVEPVTQHRFDDGTVLDLPGGSRAAQLEAVDNALGEKAGLSWVAYVDDFAEVWEALRKDWFERPYSPEHAAKDARDLLSTRLTLQKLVTRELRDERLRLLALHRVQLDGHEPRNVPAWEGVWSYVEQNFGVWTLPGGMGQLADVLARRLETRGVTVLTGRPARDLVLEGSRVRAVRIDEGTLEADTVVCAIDPRRLPALAPFVARTMPAIPPTMCHIGLVGEVPDLPAEVVLHGDPTLVLHTNGTAEDGRAAWTVLVRGGRRHVDVIEELDGRGIDVRRHVEVRVDRSPGDQTAGLAGSPYGVQWRGRATTDRKLATPPVTGVHRAGVHAAAGAELPLVGLTAAVVAERIGPA